MMADWQENFKRLEGAYAPATIRGYKADFEAFAVDFHPDRSRFFHREVSHL